MRGPSLQPLEFPLFHLTARFPPRSSGTRRPFCNARLLLGLALFGSQMFAAAAHAADYHQFVHNGHTIDYALILPDHFDKSKAYPVLLALPPGDQSRQMVEAGLNFYWEAEAKRRAWVVISPSAPSGESFYTGLDQELRPLLTKWLTRSCSRAARFISPASPTAASPPIALLPSFLTAFSR
jgi:hypothetical protein